MPGESLTTRLNDSSSSGFATNRSQASTSLMWACSKKRTPERTRNGIPRRVSSICSSIEW